MNDVRRSEVRGGCVRGAEGYERVSEGGLGKGGVGGGGGGEVGVRERGGRRIGARGARVRVRRGVA